MLHVLALCILVSYLMINIFCSQCLSRLFLKEFSVPANTVSDGKLAKYSLFLMFIYNVFEGV